VRQGFYLDSVALMRLSREIAAMDGVIEAALMMATPANLAIMREAGLLDGTPEAQGNDLMLALRASERSGGARRARCRAEGARPAQGVLPVPPKPGGRAASPRRSRRCPTPIWRSFRCPGVCRGGGAQGAAARPQRAPVFSDNVPIEDEVALKREARELGLLMMGPDCGTAVINGAPLAFANRLARGSIGSSARRAPASRRSRA
jgi:FdrA protein